MDKKITLALMRRIVGLRRLRPTYLLEPTNVWGFDEPGALHPKDDCDALILMGGWCAWIYPRDTCTRQIGCMVTISAMKITVNTITGGDNLSIDYHWLMGGTDQTLLT